MAWWLSSVMPNVGVVISPFDIAPLITALGDFGRRSYVLTNRYSGGA
jgi:hypothetical protein